MTFVSFQLGLTGAFLLATAAGAQGPSSNKVMDAASAIQVLTRLEHQVEAAFQRADSGLLNNVLGEDFRFRHGGGQVEGKHETIANFARPGNFVSRTLTAVEVELHDGIAITNGRIEVRSSAPREYTICYTRLYEHRGGQWRLLSHRTFREKNGFSETCAPR